MVDFLITAKTQFVCLLILLYIGYIYIKEGNHLEKNSREKHCNQYFDWMLICAEISVFLDGVTAYTAMKYKTFSPWANENLHFLFYVSIMLFSTCFFMYWLSITEMLPKTTTKRVALYVPCILGMLLCSMNMSGIEFVEGKYLNYSMGVAVYICFATVALYLIFTIIGVFRHIKIINANKRSSIIACTIIAYSVFLVQLLTKELLVSCFATTLITISMYLLLENPSVKMVEVYHQEMLMGFSTLLDKKDGGTGNHIRRTSEYAVIIAKELRTLPKYRNHITKDYIKSLKQAAPMHDIGKISIPDSILQKPGKLTDEEFDIMKTHSMEGSKIIKESFEHLMDREEESMAYKVALNHHEKWNGRGYPNGLSGTDIPLCARIMAVADVFDAVSAKRCYRDAMPLEKCFSIIAEGKETDFDPEVVEAFFKRLDDIKNVYYNHRDDE